MAQLELLPVAPRTHICWDPVPAACLALLSWSSASPTLLLAKSFPTFQQPTPAVLLGAGILDNLALSLCRRKPQSWSWRDSLWHSWGGQPPTLWRMELIWSVQGSLLQNTSGKTDFFQSEENATWFAEAQKPWLAWIHGVLCQDSVCQAHLAHLQPSYNTSSTPKLLQFLICMRCTRSCFVFLWVFPMSWAKGRSLCWLSFQVFQCSSRPCSFCLFTEVQFPALLAHTCWQHNWSFLLSVLQIIWLWVFGSLLLLEAFSSRRWAHPRRNRPQNFHLVFAKVRWEAEDQGRRELYPKSIDYREKTPFIVSKLQQY